MKCLIKQTKSNSGFTLVEVLISMLILSIVIAAALMAFVYAIRISRENKYEMTAMNLANERVEYIRALSFAEIGTKTIVGGTTIYGDPKGEILQTETTSVGGANYSIITTISWEDQGGWSAGDVDWDYKSIRVEVVPQNLGVDLSKVVETYVTRDSTQPALTGANISLRTIRGWKEDPATVNPVTKIKVSLNSGPSAPRQVQTSSKGIGRFIDLGAGNYNVNVDPSGVGMMLLPGTVADWSMNLAAGITQTKEFEVEHPCHLKLTLKSLEGYPINLGTGVIGAISVDIPYGTDISMNFTSSDLDSQGCLPQDFLGDLWPVGSGYAGVYSVTDVSIPDCTYFGVYETGASGEVLWSGTFSGPGTVKEVICYFGVFPDTPSDMDANWAEDTGNIMTDYAPYTADNAEFSTDDEQDTIIMQPDTAAAFNAEGIYFENTGSTTNPGLLINNRSILTLNSGLIVFRGEIEIATAADVTNRGSIKLSTVFTDGSLAHSVPGSEIGGLAYVDKRYGKLYLVEPMVLGGSDVISPGAYYFYDGLVLPDNASELIPITKDNYVY